MPPRAKKPQATTPGVVPKEALDYFAQKGLKIGFNYYEVWREEHSAAFTAAKILELDILAALRGTVERAIEDGTTFQQFRKDIEPLLDKSGWSDYHKETPKKVRLRTIYETNMRVARTCGQWQRIERTKKVLPYLIYELGPSLRHRAEHEAWAGTTLPVDDPWWDEHVPPSAYGCKCRVRQAGEREVERRGGATQRPPSYDVVWELPDGRRELAPVGVHPSFAYNPGKSRMAGLEAVLERKEKR